MRKEYSFEDVMTQINSRSVVMEDRPPKWKFGTLNYGEVVDMVNKADGDCWDVFAPGYDRFLDVDVQMPVKNVIGYLKLNNNNHKIAVQLYQKGFDQERALAEIKRYCFNYTCYANKNGRWVWVNGFV